MKAFTLKLHLLMLLFFTVCGRYCDTTHFSGHIDVKNMFEWALSANMTSGNLTVLGDLSRGMHVSIVYNVSLFQSHEKVLMIHLIPSSSFFDHYEFVRAFQHQYSSIQTHILRQSSVVDPECISQNVQYEVLGILFSSDAGFDHISYHYQLHLRYSAAAVGGGSVSMSFLNPLIVASNGSNMCINSHFHFGMKSIFQSKLSTFFVNYSSSLIDLLPKYQMLLNSSQANHSYWDMNASWDTATNPSMGIPYSMPVGDLNHSSRVYVVTAMVLVGGFLSLLWYV